MNKNKIILAQAEEITDLKRQMKKQKIDTNNDYEWLQEVNRRLEQQNRDINEELKKRVVCEMNTTRDERDRYRKIIFDAFEIANTDGDVNAEGLATLTGAPDLYTEWVKENK